MAYLKNSKRQAYTGDIELAFDYENRRVSIESEKITYLLIESDYDNNVLPIIYISMAVNSTLYKKIIKYKDSAKFYLKIKKKNKNSTGSIYKEYLSGTFKYIPSTSNPNYTEDLNNTEFEDSNYKRIMVGLVSIELTNKLRQSFNGIYNDIDTNTLLAMAVENTNCVIEKPTYNDHYDTILIPPISSRWKFIDYIFKKNSFYDTNFRYFMDFERSYLLSKKGLAIDAGNGEINNVIVDIRSVTENEAYYDGIEIKNRSYYGYINPSNSNVTVNDSTEKVANQIVAVDEDANVTITDLNINNTSDSSAKQMFVRTDNAAFFKTEIESNSIVVDILKQHIDGSPFTPNKCITVNNYGEYKKYNGTYIMSYKREFYKCVSGEFVLSCNLGLKQVNDSSSTNSSSNSTENSAIRSSSKRTTTATKKRSYTKQ